ncbi:unnamed protein product [Paramecium pentaurelia]|uniref:Uncharacterized protein n=1 Tax=Paramecium pentaurelia TaxID=43138 RepID=A0A8S1VK65_9CILI|nr:unnamed protein product [Paramecium pentaurelia]
MECNLIIIGDQKVGKSSILLRLSTNQFSDQYEPTIWTSVKKKIDINNISINFNFTDICCQEHYYSIRKNSYINKDFIIIVFDINQIASFHNVLQHWNQETCQLKNIKKIIIANKIDLRENDEQIEDYKLQVKESFKDCHFFSCSAKTGENIDDVFKEIAKIQLESLPKKKEQQLPREEFCSCLIF